MGAESFRGEGERDRWTDMTKLIDTFLNSKNKLRRNKEDLMNNCVGYFAFLFKISPIRISANLSKFVKTIL